MPDFQFYVTDDRYEVPTMTLVQTKDAQRARHLAERLLAERHHHAVEVWSGERLLFRLSEPDRALPASAP